MIPAPVMRVLAVLVILCQLQAVPGIDLSTAFGGPPPLSGEPEPMPPAMTAGAVLTAPEPDLVEMLACGIYQEAGGDECSDDTRRKVGDVMLNRVEDSRFPDTLEAVLTAPGQYGRFSKTGIVWPERAKNPGEKHAVERAYRIATELLIGQHSELFGQGYVWQAEFEQGTDGFWQDGLYFGR